MKDFGQKVGAALVMILAIVIAMAIGRAVVGGIYKANAPKDNPNGYVMDSATFNKGCMSTAYVDGVTEAQAQTYCTCTYNGGVEKYGAEGFTTEFTKLGTDGKFTPEINAIINKCVQEAMDV